VREIKFRAWDNDRKKMFVDRKWVEYRHNSSGEMEAVNYNRKGDEQKLIILQYAGLKDMDGVEIYEGDVVEWVSRHKGAIKKKHIDALKWDDEGACFLLYPFIFEPYAADMKLIGNIHENPELLGDNNDS